MSPELETATLGGGCFWCVEAALRRIEGVEDVTSGYAGGHLEDPTYEQVCAKTTGHAEVVQVAFDPEEITYRELLEVFFTIHDPTTKDRQGNDVGPQYRSIVLTHDDQQHETAQTVIAWLEDEGIWEGIVTEVEPLETFYEAEDHHQGYYEKNPSQGYCQAVIDPKLQKLRKRWADRLKQPA